MPPVYDDNTAPAPKNPKPTQPKPPPYKPPTPAAGANLVGTNTGSRAYAGRNPALTSNPTRTPAFPQTQGILPYKSRIAYTSKLANTAAQLLDAPYLVNYWLNDIVNYRKEVMDDRRDLAKEQYENKAQEYDRKFDNALEENRFDWIVNHPDPESNPEGWKKLVDKKTPVDYGVVNKRLEDFVQQLRGANRNDYYAPNSPYNLNLAFDRGLTEYFDKQGQRRDDANAAQLSREENEQAVRVAKKEYAKDIRKKVEDGDLTEAQASIILSQLEQGENGPGITGLAGATGLAAGSLGQFPKKEDSADKSENSSTFDAVTKSIPVVGPWLNAIGEDNLNEFDDKVLNNQVGELKEYGLTAIDYLSRPLNAVAEMTDATLALDKEKGKHGNGKLRQLLNAASGVAPILGGNVFDSVDEIVSNPSTIGKILSAGGEGFTNEYDGGFAKVIANEALRNPNTTIHDDETYQTWAGLGLDIALDPLNFVGVGLVTKPATLANQAVRSRKLIGLERIANQDPELQRLAVGIHESLRGIPAENRLPDSLKSVNEVYDILTGARQNGGTPKNFPTKAAKTEYIKKSQQDLKALEWELQHYGTPVNAKISSLNDLRAVYADVFDGLKSEAGNLAYLDEVERLLQVKVNKGELTPEQVNQIQETVVTVPAIARAIADNGKLFSQTQRADKLFENVNTLRNAPNANPKLLEKAVRDAEAARKGVQDWTAGDFYDLLGPKWHYGSGLSRDETNKLLNATYAHLKETDKSFRSLDAEIKAVRGEIARLRPRANAGDEIAKHQLELAQYKLPNLYRRLNTRQAAAFLQAVKVKRSTAVGQKAYVEPKNAEELIAGRDQIKAQLADPNISIEDQQQLTEALQQITSDLKDLEIFKGAYGVKNLPSFDNEIVNLAETIPARFVTDEGLDVSDALRLVYVDPATLVSKVTDKVQNAAERQWAEKLKNTIDEYTETRYLQEQEKVTRRNREAAMDEMLRNNLNWYKGQPVATLTAKQRAAYNKIADEIKRKGNVWFPAADRQRVMAQVAQDAFNYAKAGLQEGTLRTSGMMDVEMRLDRVLGLDSTPDEIYTALTHRLADQHEKLKAAKASVAKDINATEQLKQINSQIAKVEKELKAAKKEHFEARARGAEASREYAKRVQEESLLYMARRSIADPEKKLTLHTVVGDYSLPSLNKLTRGMDSEAKNAAIAKTARNIFNDVFQPPSKEFGELADAYRQRTAQSARRIQVNLEELNATLGKYPPEVRKNAFKAIMDNNPSAFTGTAEQYDEFMDAFRPIIKAFREPEKIGDYYVNAQDINRYLPEKYKLRDPNEVSDPASMIDQMKKAALKRARANGKNVIDHSVYDDPFDIAWTMRLALEQARAQKSFMHTLGETFGIKNVKTGLGEDGYYEAVQKLKSAHNYRSVEALGPQYVFDKDTADLIDKMVKSLEPEQINKFVAVADRAVGYWKAAVTIYNPAYWVKNGIGEIYMSFLAGVKDPTVYKTATNLVKHARGDGHKLDALKALHPWAEHIKNPQTGARVAFRMANGKKVTYDDLLVAYHENSLKTGFFDNDLSRRMTPTRRKLEQYEGLNKIAKGHERLRSAGEGYEDMLRMAHFIDVIKKSSKPFPAAAKDAAEQVRKYHFDYDDFSQLEKTVMLRAFPFYKWTRKAAPLMLQMLFMKPGKVSAPFKIANTTSNQLSSQDIMADDNGWAPNYEGIAPDFVRDMWAYELFGDAENATYGGIPLPTAETYRNLTNPVGMGSALLNPLVKLPYNMTNELTNDVINDDGYADSTSVFDEFMNGLSPQTKFINKGEDYKTDDFDLKNFSPQEIFSFLTGAPVFDGEKTDKTNNFNLSRP